MAATILSWEASAAVLPATASPAVVFTTGTNFEYITLDFDKDTDENCYFYAVMPQAYSAGTITASVYWTATTTGDVVWDLQFLGRVNDEVLDAAISAAASVTDSVTAGNDLMVAAITLTTPALVAGDFTVFKLNRDANNGSDTLAADAKFLALELQE